MKFQKGTLRDKVRSTTRQALEKGTLVPIPTDETIIEEQGVPFFVRVLSHLKRKEEARYRQNSESRSEKAVNPFLPPEQDLLVSEITDTHIGILNKFNVVDDHLLIVTRDFEEQEMLLTLSDFEALWLCISEYDSLGFYNGGREAGASQAHKHLQLVPLPLSPQGAAIPIAPLLEEVRCLSEPCRVPGLPFLHAFVRFDAGVMRATPDAAHECFRFYAALLEKVGMTPPEPRALTRQSSPYCLLATREWMLIVPRVREHFEDISFNALAFAGSFFVRNEIQVERLRTCGIMKALASVCLPPQVS